VNFMLALNVTIYGLGIVFLALLVLMVAIMLLGKVFSMATGKDSRGRAPAPPSGPSAPAAGARRGGSPAALKHSSRSSPRFPARSSRWQ
jgi:Na+-transporting methylmalonyl-CoA/oxaloacetate decarboxylase gamma subunit